MSKFVGCSKAVFRQKGIVLNDYSKIEEKFLVSYLRFQLRLEKEDQSNSK